MAGWANGSGSRRKKIACPLGGDRPSWRVQYHRFVELFGHEPTHIDSHHHVHMFAQIYPIVAAFAPRVGGHCVGALTAGGGAEWARPAGGAQRAGFQQRVLRRSGPEELFLQTLDRSIARGERSWR